MAYFNQAKINIIHETHQKGKPMSFKNEYVLPLEQETSDFLTQAQKILNVTAERKSKWTVDRDRELILTRTGGGHSTEAQNEDYWSFLTKDINYSIDTEIVNCSELSPDVLCITRSISFRGEPEQHPSNEALQYIKEAFSEYKDWGISSDYKNCHLTLIDSRTGEEI